MSINIGGIPFDMDPLTDVLDVQVQDKHYASEISRLQVYFWDCTPPDPAGNFTVRLTQDGKMNLVNIVEFKEFDGALLTSSLSQTKTTEMKIKVFGETGLNSVRQMNAIINRIFGKQHIKIDISAFDWLKPFASFVVWADIRYHYFQLTNAAKNLRFYIGLPHSVSLTADVVKLCGAEGLKAAIQGGRTLDPVSLGLAQGGKGPNRTERRRYLRARKRTLERIIPLGEADLFGHIRRELEEIERELKELMEDGD